MNAIAAAGPITGQEQPSLTAEQLQAAMNAVTANDPLAAAAAAAVQQQQHQRPPIYYVTYRDQKEPAARNTSKKAHGHSYTVKFFLVDNEGTDHLAAVGEDLGDAHYSYTNEPGFPFLRARNRGEVEAWLQQQIRESEMRAGLRPETVLDAAASDPAHILLPKFVGKDHEKQQLPDGGHVIRWYLIDEVGKRHLAVVGKETHTHDGHYDYATFGLFEQIAPLRSHNQKAVEAWADTMCGHGGLASALPGGKAGGGPALSSGTQGTLFSDYSYGSSHRLAGRPPLARGTGTGKKAGAGAAASKHDLLRQATANAKRQKVSGGGRAADPHFEAREVVAAELRRWVQEEAVRRESAKQAALSYVEDQPSADVAADVADALKVLKQAAAQASFLGPAGGRTPSHQQQAHLLEVVTSLQRLAHCYAPLRLIATPELKETLHALASNRHPEVAALASGILSQWLANLVTQAQVLGHPRYVQDPRPALEATLEDRRQMDPVVTAITRRPVGSAAAGGGNAAGGGTPAGGAETPSQALHGISGTPGGLSSMPSEVSLPSLDATAGGGAVAGSAGEGGEVAGQPQTAERRRLHLDTPRLPSGGSGGDGGGSRELEVQQANSVDLLDLPAQMDTETAELVQEAAE